MPPRQKTAPEVSVAKEYVPDPYGLESGMFVNVVVNGQARHKNAEVLRLDVSGLTIRTNPNGLSLAEVTLVPWSAIEGIGLIGKR